MKSARRRAALASMLALAGTAVAVPIVASGTASAESNSRMCGRYWLSEDPQTFHQEIVTVLYKVTKLAKDTCDKASRDDQHPTGYPIPEQIRSHHSNWQRIDKITKIACEEWSDRPSLQGGILDKSVNVQLKNVPPENFDAKDICTSMEYSTKSDMRPYWVHWDGISDIVDFVSDDIRR